MPLSGIRVLDFTRHLPGPYCTDLLRRLGAEVIKIEPPVGDPTRYLSPFVGEHGALFAMVNGGKRSVVVDLKSVEGREFIYKLVEVCDVVVESYRPGMAATFGIDYKTLSAINPRLVSCSISGYGAAVERSAHDLNFVALAGLLDLQRDEKGRPILPATQIGDMGGGLFGALSILAALLERQKTGTGREIDISMADATRAMMPTAEALYRGTHERPESFMLTGALPNYDVYETADGKYLAVAPLEAQFWDSFCKAIGHPELIPLHVDEGARGEVKTTVARALRQKSRADWETVFDQLDICVEPVLSIAEAHERYGDPMQKHPIGVNFPRDVGPAESLGASLGSVATIAGLDAGQKRAVEKSAAFVPRHRLKRFLFKAQRLLRNR
ncbi:MAG TPA: CoA transferase [Thermoanaerobaculia bacterium]|nr:CoA transferase [Thermoanaerobaculia bacterium]